jgi:hypothetical protein
MSDVLVSALPLAASAVSTDTLVASVSNVTSRLSIGTLYQSLASYGFSANTTNITYSGLLSTAVQPGYADTGILAQFVSTTSSYNQVLAQNKSNATGASTNFIAANNQATSTTNFAEFGINSSTFSGVGPFNAAGAAYLASYGVDLVVGTTTANKIHFCVNGGATDAMAIDANGNVLLTANTSPPALTVNNQMVFALTSNTNLRISVRGTDGVTRTGNITLS